MKLLIENGRIIDPSTGADETGDLLINGRVIGLANLADDRTADLEVVDATGLWVVPGLIDAHVHLREPGQEHKETIETGLAAAAAGGFTAVLAMPNTTPANDNVEITRMMIERAAELEGTRLYPVPAITLGRAGEELAPLADLARAGAVAFSDDGDGVADESVMERALQVAAELDLPLAQHCEDPELCAGGVVHAGPMARKIGLPGWPAEAEERMLERDIELVARTGARLHVCHISTRGGVELVREAKGRGLPVTAEVTPHHMTLSDESLNRHDPSLKVNPPLRSWEHVLACRSGLADGTIDIVATDHAPHTREDKKGGFAKAAFGMIGLETAVPVLLTLVEEGALTPARMIEALTTGPSRVFGLPGGTLRPGAVADVTLIDPARWHMIDPRGFRSKARNTPFGGIQSPGRAVRTFVAGREVFALED
jgi:dihydroorotase